MAESIRAPAAEAATAAAAIAQVRPFLFNAGMVEHCCRSMAFEVRASGEPQPADADKPVLYDPDRDSYALVVHNRPAGVVPISYCPWCATRLRRVRAKGLTGMSPETCRNARHAVSMSQRELAEAIGESLATVFHYEMGKPVDAAVAGKLLRFFEECQIAADRSGRIGRYQT